MRANLFDILACPDCQHYPLHIQNPVVFPNDEVNAGQIVCPNCDSKFDFVDGIPILLPTRLRVSMVSEDARAGERVKRDKQIQTNYYDKIGRSEFEITRPHNTGRLYKAILDYKIGKSLRIIKSELEGAMVLCICCGSGMDLEYLCNRGSKVVGMDISLGAVLGAKERARRFGLDYELVVGDAEQLPFHLESFDFGYVHDGLHHLPFPYQGLQELWRTSRRAVVLSEPNDALLTRLSVILGISGVDEEAGNKVRRFDLSELRTFLKGLKPTAIEVNRSLMWYPHEPPPWFGFFNRDWAFNTYWFMLNLLNHVLGKWGNKLTVTSWK